jgi:hypothetical protein
MPGVKANDAVERINGKEFIPRFEGGNQFINRKEICLIFIAMIQICVVCRIYVMHCSMVVISLIEINCNMATCLCSATLPMPARRSAKNGQHDHDKCKNHGVPYNCLYNTMTCQPPPSEMFLNTFLGETPFMWFSGVEPIPGNLFKPHHVGGRECLVELAMWKKVLR